MFLSILISTAFATEPECGQLATLPEVTQVAWISPITEQAWPNEYIEVVRFVDFRTWAREGTPEAKEVLHAVGMISGKSSRAVEANDYKITIFDIKSEWLCRPIVSPEEGELVEGVPICHTKEQRMATFSRRFGFTGCGTIENTSTNSSSFNVYRIPWSQAVTWGFTTMPLDRFLDGA